VILERAASGNPFDNGEFKVIEESVDAPLPDNDPLHFSSDRVQWSKEWDLVTPSTN
jgi:hypothetical protein